MSDYWFGFSVLLILGELYWKRGYCFCLAMMALLIAFVSTIFPALSLVWLAGLFVVFSLFAIVAWRRYLNYQAPSYQQDGFDVDSRQYLKREFVLVESLIKGRGAIEIDDQIWNLKSDHFIQAGERVIVYGVDGVVLKVRKS